MNQNNKQNNNPESNSPTLKIIPGPKTNNPESNSPTLKIIPLGGSGEVTKNMYVYEYGDEQLIVDCGMGFPKADMLGVDILIPDVDYLEKHPKNLHGILLTHGHEDHIGGLPFILPRLPKNLPIYGSPLTVGLAEEKVREFGLTNPFIAEENHLVLGSFDIDLIHITHSIPNCKHLFIKTPAGNVYHGADYKFDLNPPDGKPADFVAIMKAASKGIDLLMSDCLGVTREGFTLPERAIEDEFERSLDHTTGKYIVTSISSSVSRLSMAINVAARHGRKIALLGRSIEKNIRIASELGFIKLPKNAIINSNQIKRYPDHQLALIMAGAQGQEGSSLRRAAEDTHKFVKLKAGDHVVISSDIIPGAEGNVMGLINRLYEKDVRVSYGSREDLHVSGHGHKGELQLMVRLLNPRNFFPIGGEIRQQKEYQQMVADLGYSPKSVVIPDSGQVIELKGGRVRKGLRLDLKDIYVDGLGIGDVGRVVLKDRQQMAKNGVVMVLVPQTKGKLNGSVKVVSRGFVYERTSQDILTSLTNEASKIVTNNQKQAKDWNYLKESLEKALSGMIFRLTERSPLILPVHVEV